MADLVLRSSEKSVVLPCGCSLQENPEYDGDVEFTFCETHRKVKIIKLDPKWPATAAAAVASVARRLPQFTTDDVWSEMDEDAVSGGDPRRMGAIMDAAARDGICQKTDDHVKSKRKPKYRLLSRKCKLSDHAAAFVIANALRHLLSARDMLKMVGCPKTLARVRLAISSAKGAQRNVQHRPFRRREAYDAAGAEKS